MMDIKQITAISFSPNKSTKKVINSLVKAISNDKVKVKEIDLTYVASRSQKLTFASDELVVIGMPVYADRLPAVADALLENLIGNNTPAVAVVTFGNRDYGDALLELSDKLGARGMTVFSAAAIVGEHCLNSAVGTGRPDADDQLKIADYGNQILEKLNSIDSISAIGKIEVKGSFPYSPLKKLFVPVGDSKCIQCGACEAECPTGAIDKSDFRNTTGDLCIFCGRCIKVCPTGARAITPEPLVEFVKNLEVIAAKRRELELFMC